MEWPLILFTTLLQLACGLSMATTLLQQKEAANQKVRMAGMAIFPLIAGGMLIAMLHLGSPMNGVYGLSNIGSSWLSRENLMGAVFAGSAFLYGYLWWKEEEKYRFLLGVATSLLGFCAIIASVMVYMIPAKVIWNSGWVWLSFVASAILFGAVSAVLLQSSESQQDRKLLVAIGLSGTALFIALLWMLFIMGQTTGDQFIDAQLHNALKTVISEYMPFIFIHIIFACLLPMGLVFRYWHSKTATSGTFSRAVIFALMLVGVLAGRSLLYVAGSAILPF